MNTNKNTDFKVFRVECKYQYKGYTGARPNEWGYFNTYRARSKSDAIRQARAENRNGDCLMGCGLVNWRATEQDSVYESMYCR